MRDFHRVILESLKEITDIILAEFDCELNSVSVVPESGAIVLKVPCSNKPCSCEAETEKKTPKDLSQTLRLTTKDELNKSKLEIVKK